MEGSEGSWGGGSMNQASSMDSNVEDGGTSIKDTCVMEMSSKDYIMEPSIFTCLKRYFQAGGMPEKVVELLSENYSAVAQTVNLLAEWLIMCGLAPTQVQDLVEDHLKDLLLKHFDPKKADTIFTEEGETPSWLESMIAHQKWRQLFYKLAEEYPDCLMLNFTIKLISDAGYQAEITNVSTACTQLEVFSRVLRTCLATILEGGAEEALKQNIPEFAKMVCHAEHTYLYTQVVMAILAQNKNGGTVVRRISQEIQKYAKQKGHDVTHITLALDGATAYPRAQQCIMSMLSKSQLNPGDVTILHKLYSSDDPPPVKLLRFPLFLELFVDSLFTSKGTKINPDHKHKYIFLLAYAASVTEQLYRGDRRKINCDELQQTSQAIDKVHHLVCGGKGQLELMSEIGTLYHCIRYPVVATGVLKWIEQIVSDSTYFEKQMDHTPLHLTLLDEIVSCHVLLHQDVLKLLINLFELAFSNLDTLIQLEMKKTVLDRMVHLMSRGCVLPVISYIRDCSDKEGTDVSLIRHFVTEVLDIICPPYTSDFVHMFLPIIENESITGSLRNEDGNDPVSDFIVHCKTNFIMVT
uniref:negative elongation factor C/D n=1 Tax=Ciona intestinalis TaxID=7719 RepID=UPI000180C134|nr:negative elongation factor C/D [Ciona intestinalis]|eukprot:XP_002129224.1 negative elongation factor C/D [Ciona intestinalis]